MNEVFESIKQGLKEAIEFSEGKDNGARVFKANDIDIKELRQQVGMSQEEFANAFGISVGTLRHWERGDRKPHGPALVLLTLVKKDPQTVLSILYK